MSFDLLRTTLQFREAQFKMTLGVISLFRPRIEADQPKQMAQT